MSPSLYLRTTLQESRGSLGRLGFFVACLAVGVAAVVSVSGLSVGLASAVGREARQLLAADLAIEGNAPLPSEVQERLAGERITGTATLKEMATLVSVRGEPGSPAADRPTSQLVELKAVEGEYPFYGELGLEPAGALSAHLGATRTVVAPDLLDRLGLEVGDELQIGGASFEITGVVVSEPDRVGMALTAGPRVFVSGEGLARADLERFGSRISYRTLVKLPPETTPAQLEAFAETIREWPELESGHRVTTYADAQPAVSEALGRVDRFLGLVALLSLLLGGVGVSQTTRAWLEGRTDAMAILRSLGFRPNEVFALYLGQTAALGIAGSALGIAAGSGLLLLAPGLIGDILPSGLEIDPWQPAAALRGLGLGLGTALLFSLAPLAAVRRVPPLRVLRRDAEPLRPSRPARLMTGATLLGGVALAGAVQSRSMVTGLAFALGIAVVAALLVALSLVVIALVRRGIAPGKAAAGPPWVRQGLAAFVRPGAGTIGAVVALGLGVVMLVTVTLVQSGLSSQLSTSLPAGAPSAFLIDIQGSQWPDVEQILLESGAPSVRSAPVVTARIAALDGRTADDLAEDEAETDGARRWALTREQRVTYLDELSPDNEVLEAARPGELWSDPERWELSVEEDYARDLGLELGSLVELDVQGIPLEFVVTTIRSVDWGTFDLNFYFVAEPAALVDAPQFRVATVSLPPESLSSAQDAIAATHPNVTVIQIRNVLEKVRSVLERLAFGVQLLGGFSVVAGLVILAGAVSASSIRRGREIALLKTLGMVRREVALMFTVEYALVGLLAGTLGSVGGVALARIVLVRGMRIPWTLEPIPVVIAIGATVLLSAAAAVLAGSRALTTRPLEALQGD